MSGQIASQPIFTAFGPNGQFLAGGLLYTYAAGSSTPIAVYQDAGLTQPWTNPIVLNAYGQALIYLSGAQTYKFNLTDANGNQIPGWPVDNINSAITLSGINSNMIPTVTNTYNLGSAAFTWATGYFGTNVYIGGLPVPTYGLTSFESGAGVTPTNYSYPPGDIRRYGAVADATANGLTGTDNTTAINNAMACIGQNAYVPQGNWGFKNLVIPGSGTLTGAGIHQSSLIALTGSTGTMFTDTGSAAKVNVSGVAFYGNNCSYTAGFKLGYNTTVYGTEGYLDELWVRDLPTAFPGIDVKANVGEFGFIISLNTGGARILGTANMISEMEVVGASSFTNTQGVVSCTEFGDGWIGSLHMEACQNNSVWYYITGNTAVDTLSISITGGWVGDHLMEISANSDTWSIGNVKYYFSIGSAWNSGTTYVIGNLVTLAGLTYYCVLGNTNQTPPNGTYWRLSPNITGGNIKSGSQYFGGNASGNNYGGQGNYSSDLMLASGTFGIKLQAVQAFKVRLINTSSVGIQHCIGNPGDATAPGNFIGQITGASTVLTTTPINVDATHGMAAGAGIAAANGSTLWINTVNPITPADGIYHGNVVYNNTGTAYNVTPTVASANINGTTQNRLAFSLSNATNGASANWTVALGTTAAILDTGFIGFLR